MIDKEIKFPKINKAIEDFINDEDGNIARSKLVTIGTMLILMSAIAASEVHVLAEHGSHSSHESHSSTSYIRDHSNHGSHDSHASHASHTSHSNTASHSNSAYSTEGDVSYGPSVSSIPGVSSMPNSNTTFNAASTNVAATLNGIDMSIPKVPHAPKVPDTVGPGDIQNVDVLSK
ncbi:His-Xaa-Ser repeat protein HxsA3 [Anaeromicropila herbilytica]|uniref:Uncharacterized protein n=1 Tax=Anaeromicropila herbilytica TaxID=2785025 RepID=A0A7R7ELH3_9FIRM|nr:His-Xaa-Ser repeat protein HxsA3 [Anaeromicropila herbilytica]BCN31076.1 hypothetical protein bsdtb5_23710 [Anaeromicropila herbilytica]